MFRLAGKPEFRAMKTLRMILAIALLFPALYSAGQAKKDSLAYQKYPTLPAMMLLLPDSATTINLYDVPKGRPTVLFFFSPDCDHCHMTTKALLEKMDSMKVADFYFFTFMPLSTLRPFAAQYRLADYKNITVAKDFQFFFPSFYGATTVPYLVIYDRNKKLVKLYDGQIKVPEIVQILNHL